MNMERLGLKDEDKYESSGGSSRAERKLPPNAERIVCRAVGAAPIVCLHP